MDFVENNTESIKLGKVNFTKKLAVIYNPISGKKTDIKDDIQKRLDENNLQSDWFETKGYLDAWKYAETLDI
jgi:diacylglycerol kinase family enzyme